MTLDTTEIRSRANEWLVVASWQPAVTRETAINEDVLALDARDLCDEVDRLRDEVVAWRAWAKSMAFGMQSRKGKAVLKARKRTGPIGGTP